MKLFVIGESFLNIIIDDYRNLIEQYIVNTESETFQMISRYFLIGSINSIDILNDFEISTC
jgi:hypothetical protein